MSQTKETRLERVCVQNDRGQHNEESERRKAAHQETAEQTAQAMEGQLDLNITRGTLTIE